jgi:hypothetical protein
MKRSGLVSYAGECTSAPRRCCPTCCLAQPFARPLVGRPAESSPPLRRVPARPRAWPLTWCGYYPRWPVGTQAKRPHARWSGGLETPRHLPAVVPHHRRGSRAAVGAVCRAKGAGSRSDAVNGCGSRIGRLVRGTTCGANGRRRGSEALDRPVRRRQVESKAPTDHPSHIRHRNLSLDDRRRRPQRCAIGSSAATGSARVRG